MIIFLGNDSSTKLYQDLINESAKDEKDIVVSCQYRFRVPESLIKSHTCVNIHYGKLPEYRGCYPIYWQIKNDTTAGFTIHYIDKGFDTGDIIRRVEVPIGSMNASELYEGLARLAKENFKQLYKSILAGTCKSIKQDEKVAHYYDINSIDFKKEKYINSINDRDIRALYFEGKQYPTIKIGDHHYEMRRSITRI
jgi:methionyl-tRNA formyltransferase